MLKSMSDDPLKLTPVRVILIHGAEEGARSIADHLDRSGFEVAVAHTGTQGVGLFRTFRPDVAVLDLEIADVNGFDLIAWFDQRPCGVIALSAAAEESDRILALELGADDFVVKPPAPRELVARIRAVHRRVSRRADGRRALPAQDMLMVGPVCVNLTVRAVTTPDNRRLPVTAAEFTVLETLAMSQGRVVSRDVLSQAALRRPWQPDDRAVDQLVFALRQKLPPDENGTSLIQTVRGGGYRLRTPDLLPPGAARSAHPAPGRPAWFEPALLAER